MTIECIFLLTVFLYQGQPSPIKTNPLNMQSLNQKTEMQWQCLVCWFCSASLSGI